MGNVERDAVGAALPQVEAFEGVVGRMLVAEPYAHLAAAGGQGPFREGRAEALAAFESSEPSAGSNV